MLVDAITMQQKPLLPCDKVNGSSNATPPSIEVLSQWQSYWDKQIASTDAAQADIFKSQFKLVREQNRAFSDELLAICNEMRTLRNEFEVERRGRMTSEEDFTRQLQQISKKFELEPTSKAEQRSEVEKQFVALGHTLEQLRRELKEEQQEHSVEVAAVCCNLQSLEAKINTKIQALKLSCEGDEQKRIEENCRMERRCLELSEAFSAGVARTNELALSVEMLQSTKAISYGCGETTCSGSGMRTLSLSADTTPIRARRSHIDGNDDSLQMPSSIHVLPSPPTQKSCKPNLGKTATFSKADCQQELQTLQERVDLECLERTRFGEIFTKQLETLSEALNMEMSGHAEDVRRRIDEVMQKVDSLQRSGDRLLQAPKQFAETNSIDAGSLEEFSTLLKLDLENRCTAQIQDLAHRLQDRVETETSERRRDCVELAAEIKALAQLMDLEASKTSKKLEEVMALILNQAEVVRNSGPDGDQASFGYSRQETLALGDYDSRAALQEEIRRDINCEIQSLHEYVSNQVKDLWAGIEGNPKWTADLISNQVRDDVGRQLRGFGAIERLEIFERRLTEQKEEGKSLRCELKMMEDNVSQQVKDLWAGLEVEAAERCMANGVLEERCDSLHKSLSAEVEHGLEAFMQLLGSEVRALPGQQLAKHSTPALERRALA